MIFLKPLVSSRRGVAGYLAIITHRRALFPHPCWVLRADRRFSLELRTGPGGPNESAEVGQISLSNSLKLSEEHLAQKLLINLYSSRYAMILT